jgi:hypothetical protein
MKALGGRGGIAHTFDLIGFIALMIEAVRTSETSVRFNETTRSTRATPHRENLKSHKVNNVFTVSPFFN